MRLGTKFGAVILSLAIATGFACDGDVVVPAAAPTTTLAGGSFIDPTATRLADMPVDLQAILSMIPTNESSLRGVFLVDLKRMRVAFGIERPGPEADQSDVIDYVARLQKEFSDRAGRSFMVAGESWAAGISRYSRQAATYPYLAFDVRNADRYAGWGGRSAPVEVVGGIYDPAASASVLETCEECPQPEMAEYRGETYYSWGDDLEMNLRRRLSPPAFDQFGRGGRWWITDDHVVRTLRTSDMQAVIDASEDWAQSMWDVLEYRSAAQWLANTGAVTAYLSSADYSIDGLTAGFASAMPGLDQAELRDRLAAKPLLRPFELLATGTGFDGGQVFTAMVIVHSNEEGAGENTVRLRQRIESAVVVLSDQWVVAGPAIGGTRGGAGDAVTVSASLATPSPWKTEFGRVEIETEGRVVIAKLYGDRTWAPVIVFNPGTGPFINPLVVHE